MKIEEISFADLVAYKEAIERSIKHLPESQVDEISKLDNLHTLILGEYYLRMNQLHSIIPRHVCDFQYPDEIVHYKICTICGDSNE